FALTVDPHNDALKERAREVDRLRTEGKPTIPTNVAIELATNPFLRADNEGLKAAIGMSGADTIDVFAETRRRKDSF
ncbi:MAG: hydroxyacylglutathione hydrolase, partial [Alphaproteobacteria bacterium]|nr:hydroxyacylglutathione hydrolase [Alphaproteobacteria bacterium]